MIRFAAFMFGGVLLVLAMQSAAIASPPAHAVLLESDSLESPREVSFDVRISRFGFAARRTINVKAELQGKHAELHVAFDQPVRPRLGVRRIDFSVQVLDESGALVDVVSRRLDGPVERFDIPISFDKSGRYRLQLESANIDASPARVRIRPAGLVFMDLVVH